MNIAIILAGGTGTRVGAGRPKQFVEIFGKPILAYTCDLFQANASINAIEIVCHTNWIKYCQEMLRRNNLSKVRWVVSGGDSFQESVIKGIHHLESLIGNGISLDDHIFIQFGCAPFTSQKIIDDVIEMTMKRGSAIAAIPCYQLLSSRDTESTSKRWMDRDKFIMLACPYGFKFSYLLSVYERARENGLLDEIEPHTTSLMYALGDVVNYVLGDQTNIKITTKEDIQLFESTVFRRQFG